MIEETVTFSERLISAIRQKQNAVCVGLDPRISMMPKSLRSSGSASGLSNAALLRRFCFAILDIVAPLVPVVKPQSAFFERHGCQGVEALEAVIRRANELGLVVVMDGKRGDIGSTAEAYASAYLGTGRKSAFGSDSLTVNPFLGDDTMMPFINRAVERDAGVFVLTKTSNPGSGFLQDLKIDDLTVSQRIADWIRETNNHLTPGDQFGPVGAVVGATYPGELKEMRARMPNAWILVPGYGSQGGTAEDVKSAFTSDGLGAIVNSSRGVIFAHNRDEYKSLKTWEEAVERSTRDMIADLANHCPPIKPPASRNNASATATNSTATQNST